MGPSLLYVEFIQFPQWTGCFFQAEDGIRDAQESRGLGDVYKRQAVELHPLPIEEENRELPETKKSFLIWIASGCNKIRNLRLPRP